MSGRADTLQFHRDTSTLLSLSSTVDLNKCSQTQLGQSESSAGEALVIVTLFSWFLL